MGPSKKSSERDREREKEGSDEERKRRRERKKDRGKEKTRERRSRSNERGEKEVRKGRDRDQNRRQKEEVEKKEREVHRSSRRRRHSSSEEERKEEGRTKRKHLEEGGRRWQDSPEEEGGEEEGAVGPGKGSGDGASLSVEETNKLRAKLGLKPLMVEGGEAEGDVDEAAPTKKVDVHAPPKNMGELKVAEKLREKMETMRETRRLARKLGAVPTLGEEEEEDDNSASVWVQRIKRKEEERKAAERRARLLQEMEEEFGVGELVEETLREDKAKAYSSGNLTGLKVEHEVKTFREGRDTILTLKDSRILADEDDILVNVNMIAEELAKKNVELKKGKPLYNPYDGLDEEEGDEETKAPAILKKYDEEIEGEQKGSFVLGEKGEVDTAEERARARVREQLRAKGFSLESAPSTIASEYYTAEEMVLFRKPRKRKKIRKRFKADDIIPLSSPSSKDQGTRDHGRRQTKREGGEEEEGMEVMIGDGEGESLKDENDSKFDTALGRTRRLLKRGNVGVVSGAAKVAGMLQEVPQGKWEAMGQEEEGEMEEDGTMIVLDTTAEFCRQVGGVSSEAVLRRSVSSLHEDLDEEEEEEKEDEEMETSESIPPPGADQGGWMEVRPETEKEHSPQADDLYQEDEPNVATGMAAALQMAVRKGFVVGEKSTRRGKSKASDSHRDREYERQREREREREISRFDRDSSFPEMKGYTPKVNIEYVDDSGRVLNTKEAFRFMSHKFHGRGSGKKKMDRRLKKIADEHFMTRSSSVDTPLNTLSMLQSKQQQSHTPYIVLSGGAHSMLAPANTLKKK